MPGTQDKRIWLAGGILAAVLLVAVGWLAVISPKLSSVDGLKRQTSDAEFQNLGLLSKVAKLRRQNDNVGQLKASLRQALAELPSDSGLPAFTRQLSTQATLNNVTLKSITVSPATAAGAGHGGSTTTTGPSTTGTGSALVAIPVTLVSEGTATDQTAFLKSVQVQGPRRALVVSTQFTAIGGSIYAGSTMTVQLSVFSSPLTPAAQAQLEKLLTGK